MQGGELQMKEPEPLRIGLAGCGVHGTNLAQAVVRASELRLVGCADPDGSAAERAARLAPGAHTCASIESLLEACEADAVVIATPHDVLAPAALSAIRAGKHVLIEKPMALNDKQARDVEAAAIDADVNCMVGYSLRFSTGHYVRDLIAAGAVGDIQAARAARAGGLADRSPTDLHANRHPGPTAAGSRQRQVGVGSQESGIRNRESVFAVVSPNPDSRRLIPRGVAEPGKPPRCLNPDS
jgi:predicted dehydrogenase